MANGYKFRSKIFAASRLSIVRNVEKRASSQHSVVMLFGPEVQPGASKTRLCGRGCGRLRFTLYKSVLPGAAKFASAASITKTQSLELGGVKSCPPVFA